MTISEAMFESTVIEHDAFTFFDRCDAFLEAAFVELNDELYNEASTDKSSEGALVKIGKALDAMVNKVIEVLKSIADKIKSFFTSDKVKKSLDEAQHAAKTNPILKDKKVEMANPNEVAKAYDKGIAAMSKKLSLAKSGNFTKKDAEEVEGIIKMTNKDVEIASHKKPLLIGSAIAILTAVVGTTYFAMNSKDQDKVKNENISGNIKSDDNSDRPFKSTLSSISPVFSELNKMITKKHLALDTILHDSYNGIKNAFTGMKPITTPTGKKKTDKAIFTGESTSETNEFNQKEYLNGLMTFVEAYDAHKGKKAYFKRTQEKYDSLQEKLKELKDTEISNEEKLIIANEASDILTVLLAEANKIPDDDFFDRIIDINFFINGVKKMIASLKAHFSISGIAVFKPRTKRGEVLLSLRKYQKDLDKSIKSIEKEIKKEEKALTKLNDKSDKAESTTTESVGEYLEKLEAELFSVNESDDHIETVGERLEKIEDEIFN